MSATVVLAWTLCSSVLTAAGGSPSDDRPATAPIESAVLADRGAVTGVPLFEQLAVRRTGLDFVHRWDPPQKYAVLLDSAMAGGGVAIGDYDGDGLGDVYLTRPHGGNRLYRNLGDFRFADVTEEARIVDNAWGLGVTFVDIDNDSDLDLYICGYDCPNRLWVNQGDGTFKEQAKAFGLDFSGASVMMAFADYDLDGDLDGYLLTNRLMPGEAKTGWTVFRDGRWTVPDEFQETVGVLVRADGSLFQIHAAQFDHLYRNNGDGTFTDVREQAGISGSHFGLSAIWWDYNGDGLPDVYVANDYFGEDQLFRNNGDGTFSNVVKAALPHTPWFSMGSDTADINNDGRLDFMGADMSGTTHYKQKLAMGDMETNGWFLSYPEPRQYMRNAVYLNSGTDRFMEVAYLTGLADTNWTWSIKFADLDNDGRVDLFISNGMTRDWFNSDLRNQTAKVGGWYAAAGQRIWLDTPELRESNLAFRNLGDLRFESAGRAWGLDYSGVSFGAAVGDLDLDGDLDLIVNNFEEPAGVYRNRSAAGHRVLVRLKGTVSNRHGIGATIRIETAAVVQVRYLTLARGFMSANEPLVHFGLGRHEKIDRLTVRWPGGQWQTFEHLAANRLYTITEPHAAAPKKESPKPTATLFRSVADKIAIRHRETPFDDYQRQPLLPNKLSQLGPGIAWGDVDGDGDEDLYVSAAAGQSGRIRFNNDFQDFSWPRRHLRQFEADQACEDMAPLFFDADGDGDLDLYVGSGGVECEPGDLVLADRLYLNDGEGTFSQAPAGALPDLRDSTSVVTAADFDRDGDLDLFVGGRSIPGKYPMTPNSRLLRNNRGRFVDVTDQLAPGLRQTGLVTSALWSDADADGWPDLLVTHEWGPIKLYRNDNGRLVDRTRAAGLAHRLGWWNGIAGRDIDNDGDIDYVATNVGLNTKYDPTPEKPVLMYVGDFDGSGRLRMVEAEYEGDMLYPVRGRSCSTDAIPALGEKFNTFDKFARAPLWDIYTSTCLSDAYRFEVNTLASGVLINDGTGKFTFRPLPRLAQASPGFGVVLTDVDGDGNADLYMVQNFFSPQPETGRMDGGLSLLLKGNGDGSFTPVWPDRSGLIVPGDATSLTVADLNNDLWPDFVVGINDGQVMAFENRGLSANRLLKVRLQGKPGNPTAVGARISVHLDDGSTQTAEVHAGGGYLSQSTSALVFGLGQSARVERITVQWPDGATSSTTTSAALDRRSITIKQSTL